MTPSPSRQWKIKRFLKEFFAHWQPNCFVVFRDKNNPALIDLGLTPYQREEIILSLELSNSFSGPKPEKDPDIHGDGLICEFGTVSDGVTIYIKLKIQEKKDKKTVAKCISFHRAERPIYYPFHGET